MTNLIPYTSSLVKHEVVLHTVGGLTVADINIFLLAVSLVENLIETIYTSSA